MTGISDQQTALAVIPGTDLVLAEKKAGKKLDRAIKNTWKSIGGVALGVGVAHCGMAILPVCAPLAISLVLGSFVLSVCSTAGAVNCLVKWGRFAKEHATAIETRSQDLRAAAQSILTRDAAISNIGQELRVEVAGDTPKILRIETVGTVLDEEDRPVHRISAQLYETVAQADGLLKRGERVAKIQEIVSAVPLDSSPDPCSSAEDSGLTPSPPPAAREPEKRLPRITP